MRDYTLNQDKNDKTHHVTRHLETRALLFNMIKHIEHHLLRFNRLLLNTFNIFFNIMSYARQNMMRDYTPYEDK